MKVRSAITSGLLGAVLVAGTIVGGGDTTSAASYGVPSAYCNSDVTFNAYSQTWSTQRQVRFTPNVHYNWKLDGVYKSETVFYSAELMRYNGSRWVPYYGHIIYGWESLSSSSIGGESRSVWHSGSYAWRVTYIYQPIGSSQWNNLGQNWSNSCHLG